MTVSDTASLAAARKLLETGTCTCVACKDGVAYTSAERGIGSLVNWIEGDTDLSGFSVADKVIGKGAAMLFVLLGVKEVYAPVMSEPARSVLQAHGITSHCASLVPSIRNRTDTGRCPMEEAVLDIEDPHEALEVIRKKREELSRLPLNKQR